MDPNGFDNIIALFCDVDDFCLAFEPEFSKKMLEDHTRKRIRKTKLCLSEVMTIVIWFHRASYRNFKDYYKKEVIPHLSWAFPDLVSYNRFVELKSWALLPLCYYLQTRKDKCSGISFIDSMPIAVCDNHRINSHKVFSDVAERGKNSMGWFYGFKTHLIVNDQGGLLSFHFTTGNVDDRQPVPKMTKGLFGKLFGDKGYISQKLFEFLFEQRVQLVTRLRKNMKNRLMPLYDKLMLRKRAIIETIHDQLKNISQIEHTRHRSPANFLVNILAAVIAYTFKEKKPSLRVNTKDINNLPDIII